MTESNSKEKEPSEQRTWQTNRRRTWIQKFKSAFRGVALGVKGPRSFESRVDGSGTDVKSHNSFWLHFPLGLAAIILGQMLNVGPASMAVLVVCIGLVVVAELLNTSIEFLASAVTSEFDETIEAALDVASGAVLVASLVAVAVGCLVLGYAMMV